MTVTRYQLTEKGTEVAKRKRTKVLAFADPPSEVLIRMAKQPSRAWSVNELRKAVGILLMTDKCFESHYLSELTGSRRLIKAVTPP
jgi:hypothetical protein